MLGLASFAVEGRSSAFPRSRRRKPSKPRRTQRSGWARSSRESTARTAQSGEPEQTGAHPWQPEHAWSMCKQCSRLVPNKFHPKQLRRRRLQRTVKACKDCAPGVSYPVPQVDDISEPVQKLPQPVLDALALFDVNTGPNEQEYNGYRAHTAPIRFSWKSTPVEERLAELPDNKAWEKAKPPLNGSKTRPAAPTDLS